jgi:hypothetical protein
MDKKSRQHAQLAETKEDVGRVTQAQYSCYDAKMMASKLLKASC